MRALWLVLLGAGLAQPVVADSDLIPPKVEATSPTGVSLADGSFTFTRTDLSIGTLSLERTYSASVNLLWDLNPIDPNTMFHGLHSTNNFDIYVTPAYEKVTNQAPYARPTVHLGTGSSGLYLQSQFTGVVTLAEDNLDAAKGRLRWVNNAYEYTDAAGTVYLFNPAVQPAGVFYATRTNYAPYAQRIASITYPDGRVRTFSYVSGQLKLVSDSSGYAIVFDWGAAGVISAACGFNLAQTYVSTSTTCAGASPKVTYGYTVDGFTGYSLLGTVTNVLLQNETYGYDGNLLMNCVLPPDASICKVANTWSAGFLSQTLADGSTWSYSFSNWSGRKTDDPITADGTVETWMTDPSGSVWRYYFTGTSPYTFLDPNLLQTDYRFTGGRTTEQFLDPVTNFGSILQSVTQPEGNQYLVEFNGPFRAITKETWKAKPAAGQPDIVKQYQYSFSGTTAQNAKPIAIIDGRGNQTDFTYASHGGVLTEMPPAPSAGAARPLKLYTYVQKAAYIKDSLGTLVSTGVLHWVLATETSCQTAAGSSSPACDAAAAQVVTTYEYGANGTANNLRVKGQVVTSGATSLRTCFGYDNQGNRIWETSPRAGLGSCP